MGLRNYLTFRKGKVKGFTLLESLIALIVISGSLLLFQSMSRLLVSEVRYQQRSEQKEWLLFVDQLEAELNQSHYQIFLLGNLSRMIFEKQMLVVEGTNRWYMDLNQREFMKKDS